MKKKRKNKSIIPILIISLLGLIAVIGSAVYENYMYAQSTEGKTPQEIANTGIEPTNINTADIEGLGTLPINIGNTAQFNVRVLPANCSVRLPKNSHPYVSMRMNYLSNLTKNVSRQSTHLNCAVLPIVYRPS